MANKKHVPVWERPDRQNFLTRALKFFWAWNKPTKRRIIMAVILLVIAAGVVVYSLCF